MNTRDILYQKAPLSWETHGETTISQGSRGRHPRHLIFDCSFRAILHDPEVFDDPEAFVPERYLKNGQLDPNARDPAVASFGYGRRYCGAF